MRATPDPGEPAADRVVDAVDPGGAADGGDLADLDPEDAFGHPVVDDPARDDDVWPDGDEDDIDV